jgi:hypothetical protein
MSPERRLESAVQSPPPAKGTADFLRGLEADRPGQRSYSNYRLSKPVEIEIPDDPTIPDTGYTQVAPIPGYLQENPTVPHSRFVLEVAASKGRDTERIATFATMMASGETLKEAKAEMRKRLVSKIDGSELREHYDNDPKLRVVLQRRSAALQYAAEKAFKPAEENIIQFAPAQPESGQAA